MERDGLNNAQKSEQANVKLLELEAKSDEVKTIGDAKANALAKTESDLISRTFY